jgi:hypothetical protein
MSKKILIMLVAVVTGAFMASVAMAVDYGDLGFNTRLLTSGKTAGTILNPEGKGDALLAAYYDVRVVNGKTQDTYFAIINKNMDNTTYSGVAATLRFREWDKSEEVFNIDIWMSNNDVWVGVLTRNPANGLTRITSPDNIIIAYQPTFFTVSKTTALSTGMDFFTDWVPGGTFNSVSPPSGFTSADLTNMGYFEIIGEERTYSKPSTTAAPILVSRFGGGNDCPNSLSAYVYIVRVDDGVSLGYNADAIANFSRNQGSLWDLLPDLSNCEDGLDQLEFELSKAEVYHGYSIEDNIFGKFSQIVTFPTKHFHFEKHTPIRLDYTICTTVNSNCIAVGAPFTGDTANFGEVVAPTIYDRDETSFKPEAGFWSPPSPTISLPFEVNVIGLYKGTPPSVPLLGNRNNVGWTTAGFQTGWMWIDLYHNVNGTGVHMAVSRSGPEFGHLGNRIYGYTGMPALSLALQEFSNANVGGAYGVIFPTLNEIDWLSRDAWCGELGLGWYDPSAGTCSWRNPFWEP